MLPYASGFTPVDVPARTSGDRLQQLRSAFTAEQLDVAIDRAARSARGTVALFAAAPLDCWDEREGQAAIELVVEFFVPPALGHFHRELEAQLLAVSPSYVLGRHQGDFMACILHSIGAGTFHQHRIGEGISAEAQRAGRWSVDRGMVEEVLHQSRVGWREVGVV